MATIKSRILFDGTYDYFHGRMDAELGDVVPNRQVVSVTGNYSVVLPTGTKTVVIIPPAANTTGFKLHGVASSGFPTATGLSLHKTRPTVLSISGETNAGMAVLGTGLSIYLVPTSGTISGVTILSFADA